MELGGRLADTNPVSILPYSQNPDFIRGFWGCFFLPFLLSTSCSLCVLAGTPAATLDLRVTSRMEASETDGA